MFSVSLVWHLQQHGNFFDYKSRLWLWNGFMAFCSAVSTESDVVLFWKQSNICWYVPLLLETCDSENQLWDNGEECRAGAEVWKSTTLACTLLLIKVAEKYTGKKKASPPGGIDAVIDMFRLGKGYLILKSHKREKSCFIGVKLLACNEERKLLRWLAKLWKLSPGQVVGNHHLWWMWSGGKKILNNRDRREIT